MPSLIAVPEKTYKLTKFTNCRLVKGDELVEQDLWVSSLTGKIVRSQEAFYGENCVPDNTIDLGGKILAPGLIDVQLNGAFGFNFSTIPEDPTSYGKRLRQVNKSLVETGVTSYLPTVTSNLPEVYQQALPYLGPSGAHRIPEDGSESLGAHVEGPFINSTKNGIHPLEVLTTATSFSSLESCYGAANLNPTIDPLTGHLQRPRIAKITAAPELGAMISLIPQLTARGIVFSIGHTEATYEDASLAVASGATMITHLFNAMRPLHHRNPGVFGVLGIAESLPRPYFGIIADGIHLHPTSIKIAYNAHPNGFILVTDAMHLVGLPDGVYDWTNGRRLIKTGSRLVLEGTDGTIAGSTITLMDCVNNFLNWGGVSVPQAMKAVTQTPARMLGLEATKGCLEDDADADLVVIDEQRTEDGDRKLVVDQVWKFGRKVFDRLE